MANIQRVAVAGKGRVGSPVVFELARAGFQTTVLTRNASRLKDVPDGVTVCEVDYDSDDDLRKALKGQDAVISTVAMSGISNQKRMIDAAIAEGVKLFIPAEYSIATRDPEAQWLPMYATVLDIQKYLSAREHQMNWAVINCGCLLEFSLDYPFVLDFDSFVATLWDGGDSAVSISTIPIVAKAAVGLLRQPERVKNHCVQVHGGVISQKDALSIAEKYSTQTWTVQVRESQSAIQSSMEKLSSDTNLGADEVVGAMMTCIAAATFGKGHFDGAYAEPDNEWLGVNTRDVFGDNEIEDAIRLRITKGAWATQSGTNAEESLGDVANGIAAKFNSSEK